MLLHTESFDMGNLSSKWDVLQGSPGEGRHGDGRHLAASSATSWNEIARRIDSQSIFAGFAVRSTSASHGRPRNYCRIMSDDLEGQHLGFGWGSSGRPRIARFFGDESSHSNFETLLVENVEAEFNIEADPEQWHYIECEAVWGDPGVARMWVNGILVCEVTDARTFNASRVDTSYGGIAFGGRSPSGESALGRTYVFDDIYVLSPTSPAPTTRLGEIEVKAIKPKYSGGFGFNQFKHDQRANDFEHYGTGSLPNGFTNRWATTGAWSVQLLDGNRVMRWRGSSANSRRALSWDLGDFDDVDFYVQVRTDSMGLNGPRLHVRGGGAAGSEDGYYAELGDMGGTWSLKLGRYLNGANAFIGDAPFAWVANEWYWMRLQAIGNTIRCKVWQGAEPSGWMVSVTDSSIARGWIGVGQFTSNSTTHDYFFDDLIVTSGELEEDIAHRATMMSNFDPTSYVRSGTPGDREAYRHQELNFNRDVLAISSHSFLRTPDGSAAAKALLRGTDDSVHLGDEETFVVGTTHLLTRYWPVNPVTGQPWLVADINGTAFGVEVQ